MTKGYKESSRLQSPCFWVPVNEGGKVLEHLVLG